MSRYTTPRTPANKDDVFLPMRETTSLLGSMLVETGKVPLVEERDKSVPPDKRTDALEHKVDDLVACLNKLTKAVSGR